MWVRPALVSSSHGRKSLQSSNYFIFQANDPTKTQKSHLFYRVITKHFPHYKVAEGNEYDEVASHFQYLNEVIVPSVHGKKTSKLLAKWLKTWYDENFSNLASPNGEKGNLRVGTASTDDESSIISQHSLNADLRSNTQSYSSLIPDTNITNEDGDLYRTDLSNNFTSISLPNRIEETNGTDSNRITSTDEPVFNSQTKSLPPSSLHHERSNSVSSEHSTSSLDDMDGIGENWWSKQGLGILSHWFDSPVADSGKKKQGQNRTSILDIPIQFIALLTYPEIDPVSRKKLTYSDLKEIGRVKNRRKVLLFLTIYSFVVRWCSFDLFLVVLFSANCGILFLMKNSGKVNMQMAKRTVRQRANYMKQWAGGLFKKNSNNAYPGPPQYYPNSSSVQPNKALTKAATDVSSESVKHRKFFCKKNNSLMDAGKTDEVKPKKKLFPRSSSKVTSASVPISLPNNSEPELNKLEHNGRLMSIDNASF